jgi:hypothetical protein
MKVGFEWYQAAWEEADEVKDRQYKQAARQNDTSELGDDLKDSDDETHALSILRRLKEPARSLNKHLGAKDEAPDWQGLRGKTRYTGGIQPWPIAMINSELADISDDYAADSSVVRLDADNMVQALRTVCVTPDILDLTLTKRSSACARDQRVPRRRFQHGENVCPTRDSA